MKAISLKLKSDVSSASRDMVIFDAFVLGNITEEWFIPAFTGSNNGLPFYPLSFLIDNFEFPGTREEPECRIVNVLRGANPEKFNQVSFYGPTDELEF